MRLGPKYAPQKRDPALRRRGAVAVKRHALALLLVLAIFSVFPAPSRAFNEQVVLPCVFRSALAMLTCKPVEEFMFMGMREGVYVYNVHYGSKFTEFYAQVFDDFVIFTSRAWQGRMSSARLVYDYTNGCVSASIEPPPCAVVRQAKCCGG
jgi:hypothetical protein